MTNPPPASSPEPPASQNAPQKEADATKKAPVREPAAKARPHRRHARLIMSFVLFWALPLALVGGYLWLRAADQYASYMGFSVRTEETSSAIELLGGITDLSSGSSSDTDILYDFLTSQELVRRVDEAVNLREIWSRVPHSQDPFFAFDTSGTIEDLQAHWERQVAIIYDSGTGLIELRVLAFDPYDAQGIAKVLLEESTEMINNLSDIARDDAISYAKEELEVAVERLKNARRAVTVFRNRTQIVDPTIDTQNQMGLLVTLQQQLAEALIDFDLLRNTTQQDDPRIVQAERRIEVIQTRIDAERRKLGLGSSGEGGEVFATLVGEYESLIVDREFAEAAYTNALAAFDSAQAEARRQSRYLATHVRPTLAERPEYPKRETIFLLTAMFLFFGWAIGILIYYSIRDRR